jgi:fatty acid cis/trans isomerase CTI
MKRWTLAGPWIAVCCALACSLGPRREERPAEPAAVALESGMSWSRDVKPVVDRRCVVCHACYDAPCQAELSSFEGAERGATKKPVYHGNRLTAMPPTRLFIDARSTAEWRERDFYSVLHAAGKKDRASLMQRMLELGRAHPLEPDRKLPEGVELDINRALSCPRDPEFDAYAQAHPLVSWLS